MRLDRFLHGLYLFLIALWCGAMTFFAAGGARIVLEGSPTRHVGGNVNRALLDALDVASYVACAVLFMLVLLVDRRVPWKRMTRGMTVRLLAVALVATFASHVLITPEMVSLRDKMPSIIDLVPKTDPLRREWGRLHGLSSLALGVRILCAAALFALGYSPRTPELPTPPVGHS